MFTLAKQIKEKIYGNRIVMFAPLYLSNYCINGCVYCPYHQKNKTIPRRKAHPGGNPPRGNRPAGYGSQAFSAGGGRRSAQQSDRVHSRINQDHLLRTSQERSDSPREREYRGYDGRELPQGCAMQASAPTFSFRRPTTKPLTKRSTPPVRRATTPTTPKRWTARWKAASTT